MVRIEGIIASSKKHPLSFEQEGKLNDYKEFLKKGLLKIAEAFIGKPIWVRTSDIRSDEYSNLEGAPKEIEKNPMLGDHGIRFSLKHPEILKAELRAIKELSEKGHKFGVMFPQVISVDEVRQAKKIFKELNMNKVTFGIMIETPAAVVIIKDLCEVGLDFVSFGTNDLTQYTLAIDRGNEKVQNIYDEMNPAVLKQISKVIRECRTHKIETSICGQGSLKPEIIGSGSSVSNGLRRGVVVDMEETIQSVHNAVQRAEAMAGTQIRRAYLAVNGLHINTQTSRGVIAVSRADNEISR